MKAAFFLVFISFALQDVHGACPTPIGLWRELSNCNQIRNTARAGSYVNGYVTDTTCQGEKRVEACLERIRNACASGSRNRVTQYMMSQLVDIDVITRTNEYFCQNIAVLAASGPCLTTRTQSQGMANCTRAVEAAYDREFSESGINMAPQTIAEVDALVPAMCRFSDGVMSCYEDNIAGVCGDAAVTVLLNLAFASTLPSCRV